MRIHPGFAVLTGVLSLAYPAVGALIASRLPANSIGWIFCGLGLLYAVRSFTMAYADYALLASFGLPWGELAAWFSTWVGLAANPTLGVFLMLLFPGGRLPSRRWRILRWVPVGLRRQNEALRQTLLGYLVNFRECGVEGHMTSLRRRGSIRL